jgi:hypothetical protein
MADITFIFDNPPLVMQASRVAWAIGRCRYVAAGEGTARGPDDAPYAAYAGRSSATVAQINQRVRTETGYFFWFSVGGWSSIRPL